VSARVHAVVKLIGITADVYRSERAKGNLWCCAHKRFEPICCFSKHKNRSTGRQSRCKEAAQEADVKRYEIRLQELGKTRKTREDGNKRQAQARISYLLRIGKLKHANAYSCNKCGHKYQGDVKHEWHHHKGYAVQYHEDVIALCKRCHREETIREMISEIDMSGVPF
jgi:hypothetical protein